MWSIKSEVYVTWSIILKVSLLLEILAIITNLIVGIVGMVDTF